MFYPVTNTNIRIIKNDMLASRCTMNSLSRENITHIGARNEDEMCNFYIMFYTSYKGKMDNFACFSDAQKFKWSLNLLSTSGMINLNKLDNNLFKISFYKNKALPYSLVQNPKYNLLLHIFHFTN